jgi:hypothetical protein
MEFITVAMALAHQYKVTVENSSPGKDVWAIRCRPYCLTKDGEWTEEVAPAFRDEEFIKRTRFTLEEAKAILQTEKVIQLVSEIK